jgi:antitoxin component YwqK of YwqJK toxin-antitoxin module
MWMPFLFVFCLLTQLVSAPYARAQSGPDKALRDFKTYVLPKISFACGVDFSADWDGQSLRAHDPTIAHDQRTGDRECNEPFRYLWFVCQSEAGKAAVKRAGVNGVLCKGTPAKHSALSLSNGTLVVERAADEDKPYVLLRKRFEALLKVPVVFGNKSGPDPYGDQTFSDLTGMPNPSLSKTDYCMVDGARLELTPLSKLVRSADKSIKCWEKGQVIIDLTLGGALKTGFATEERGRDERVLSHYDNGRLHGEQRTTRGDKVLSLTHYDQGKRVWWQETTSSGLTEYSHQYADGTAHISLTVDGKVYSLSCTPSARDDKLLKQACGFGAPRTTRIYDGTNKVNRIETWRDGVRVERKSGDSDYAERSEVAFKNEKKHGHERITHADGSTAAELDWNNGVKDGREIQYDETGKKKVAEIVWRAGEEQSRTEYYLNGNRRSVQQFDRTQGIEQTFWDTGQLYTDKKFVACVDGGYHAIDGFCEQGLLRIFFEDGTKQEEAQYHAGKLHGTRRMFWSNGKPASVEQYDNDVLQKAKRWDESGKLVEDAEYEADGSRKLR